MRNDDDSGSSTERLSPKAHFAAPILGEVLPARIDFLYQSNLLLPAPSFDLFLSPDARGLELIFRPMVQSLMRRCTIRRHRHHRGQP